ncbi:hypothetical protein SAMCFNEI73_Ch3491 [Sinorhizobium americanum]|uniref:Uncharacterized protein n=1 Tax=Sinorhizobium americanum TaxID=194963 RepID=A0A1L3LRR2_9HYPH|nr:hypothetical protein SAMCCGM7_Ch3369 [Sinorhizobium americanum CCGM7]APG92743.1 hypothetical protein SAMCFNEI73_Ch3491 [Sinorhizobium americanum]
MIGSCVTIGPGAATSGPLLSDAIRRNHECLTGQPERTYS